MKQILGDNQFFGINHNDIDKGDQTKKLFNDNNSIIDFINSSINLGLSGFMINSNSRGYEITSQISKSINCEIHYSIPYPHKFASMVNEGGMLVLLKYVLSKSSKKSLLLHLPQFLLSGNIKYILPLILDLEIPSSLPPKNYVYLQNIVTDLLIGMKRYDLLESYCNLIIKKGYYPGLITLNPLLLHNIISNFKEEIQKNIVVCFNINNNGFNVFPNLQEIENYIYKITLYKKMGMSILASGGTSNIQDSLKFIKKLPLDYVVYGSSSLINMERNYVYLNSN